MSHDCAVILAGGTGSRLKPYTNVLPKPLVPVCDVPILEIMIGQLRRHGFRRLILAVNYRNGLLRSYFGNGHAFGVDISYSTEQTALGTVGPLHLIADELPESFLVMNGDVLTDFDYRACLKTHDKSGDVLTLGTFERRIQVADGVLTTDDSGSVTSITEKPTIALKVSLGINAMSKSVLQQVPRDRPFGMDGLVSTLLDSGQAVNTYHHTGEWYDIGCPQDLERANEAYAARPHKFVVQSGTLAGVA